MAYLRACPCVADWIIFMKLMIHSWCISRCTFYNTLVFIFLNKLFLLVNSKRRDYSSVLAQSSCGRTFQEYLLNKNGLVKFLWWIKNLVACVFTSSRPLCHTHPSLILTHTLIVKAHTHRSACKNKLFLSGCHKQWKIG